MAVEEQPTGEDKESIVVAMAGNHEVCQNGVLTASRLSITNGTPNASAYSTQSKESKESNGIDDDELTSLSWLQDTNLLKNIRMGTYGAEKEDLLSNSPSSDFLDEPVENVTLDGNHQDRGVGSLSYPGHMPYNPTVHINAKPPYSFSCLIFMAIEDSPAKALPVKDIYTWILNHFPYFQNAPTGWKNSVRHNLSLSKFFRKVKKEKGQNIGKGSLWCIDPEFRPNLIQALQKAPSMANMEFNQLTRLTSPLKSLERDKCHPFAPTHSSLNIPSPELFPYLSRRLASSMKDSEVDAAATMLALKNGPSARVHSCSEESENDSLSSETSRRYQRKRLRLRNESPETLCKQPLTAPVITSSPSEDHTYSACLNQQDTKSPTLSPCPSEHGDENESSVSCLDMDSAAEEEEEEECEDMNIVRLRSANKFKDEDEERKKLAEGARALLNLAKIATKRRELRVLENS